MRNPFATKARKLHNLIVPKEDTLLKYMRNSELTLDGEDIIYLGKVMMTLDRIHFPEGKSLRYYMVRGYRCKGCGDNSFLYVSDRDAPVDDDNFSFIDETWKNIEVEPSAMGMWQAYLLMTSIHVMPFYWHGGYNKRRFILSPADLKKIPAYKEMDFSGIDDSKLQPEVKFTQWLDDEYMGMVSCTYWTEWGGLIRETVYINMEDGRITKYGPEFSEVLFGYESDECY